MIEQLNKGYMNFKFSLEYILISTHFFFALLLSFFAQRDWHYPISSLIFLNFCVYLLIYGRLKILIKSSIAKTLIFLAIWSVFSFVNYFYIDSDVPIVFLFTYSLVWFMSFYISYNFQVRNCNINYFIMIAAVFYICGVIYNIYSYNLYRNILDLSNQYNTFYFVLIPLPFLCWKLPVKYRYLCLALTSILIILSVKRSGFIVCFLIILINIFYDLFFNKKLSIYRKVLIIISVIVIFQFAMTRKYDELTQMFMRLERITEDGGSGRDELFINAFQQIKNFDIENLILGHGFLSFHYYNSYIISSHNDLSEITYSYGIVGLLLLILFYFLVARRFYFLCKNKDSLFLPYAEAFVILLVLGFLASMFFFQYYSVLLFSFFGVMEGYLQKSKR